MLRYVHAVCPFERVGRGGGYIYARPIAPAIRGVIGSQVAPIKGGGDARAAVARGVALGAAARDFSAAYAG